MKEDITLIIPDKPDQERDALAEKWSAKYGSVLRVGKFWIKPDTQNKKVALYGNDSFCLVLAQILNLEMISPKDEVIGFLDKKWTKRHIKITEIGEIDTINYPKFVKPVTPKLFKSNVYDTPERLAQATAGLKPAEKIMVSDIIAVNSEVRSFILDQQIKDLAFYEGQGNIAEVREFIEAFLSEVDIALPKTFVLDAGHNDIDGWFIIEFNSSWGAGLNFCDPELVVDCIQAATQN